MAHCVLDQCLSNPPVVPPPQQPPQNRPRDATQKRRHTRQHRQGHGQHGINPEGPSTCVDQNDENSTDARQNAERQSRLPRPRQPCQRRKRQHCAKQHAKENPTLCHRDLTMVFLIRCQKKYSGQRNTSPPTKRPSNPTRTPSRNVIHTKSGKPIAISAYARRQ